MERSGRYGAVAGVDGRIGTDIMPGVFAQIGMEYGHKYGGANFELFAQISEKNHGHSTLNPLAAYTKRMSLEEIMGDIMIAYPNTRPMCSANCDGAAAAVVVSGSKLKTLSQEQQRRAVKVAASVLTSDPYQEACQVLPDVNTLTRNAAKQAYEQAGIGPEDLDLVELHDCFATAELVHYDNLMLCEEGGAVDFFKSGAPFRDGQDARERLGRPAVEGPPDRRDRHREHLGADRHAAPDPPRRSDAHRAAQQRRGGFLRETALRISLVTEVIERDALWNRAHEIAATIAAKPSIATQGTGRSIWESQETSPDEALKWGFHYAMMGNDVASLDRSKAGKTKWRLR